MTLIVTTVHRDGVTQVADRKVSTRVGSVVSEFDALANKTVLFEATDAFVVVAYTGLAYVGQVPTDQWIVEQLRQRPVAVGRDGVRPVAVSVGGGDTQWPSLDAAVERLAVALGTARPADQPLTLVIAGWQRYRRKRPRPVGLTVAKAGSGPGVVRRVSRHVGRCCCLITEPDGYLSEIEQLDILRRLRSAEVPHPELLSAAIRKVASRSPGVGPHCMSTVILHPRLGRAIVRYDSPAPTLATVTSARGPLVVPVVFSPWLVTRTLTLAPAVVSGGSRVTRVGPWEVVFEGTISSPSHQGLSIHFSQRRPDRPR